VAETFGNLYVYYNNRICPVTTLANDFCTKLYGKPSYKGLTAEQVLTGWLFYYDDWKSCPMIKIKGEDIRHTLGISGKYACLNDFVGHGQFKLDSLLAAGNRNAQAANEKFRLVSMVSTGSLLRIWCIPFPEGDEAAGIDWLSLMEQPPTYLPKEDRQFIIGGMNYVALCLMEGHNIEANRTLKEIRTWQEQHLTQDAVSDTRFRAEQLYNSFRYTRPLAMACATIGLLLFVVCIMLIARGKTLNLYVYYGLTVLMAALWLLLTFALGLRWVVSGHIPLSNGFETMQFLAWVTALISFILCTRSRNSLVLSFGYLICGMTLMVSMMSSSNPQITLLMPVLQSPLLTLHVAVIMIAYCLLAFTMLNGVTGLILHAHNRRKGIHTDRTEERLQVLSQLLLYPAVFCLTTGIFIGAVWANQSWGRYWGWDPEEVWALITMLVYAAPIHSRSLPFLAQPKNFHLYMVLAFLAVLFTYFGVNFILGGMHAYA
jgi:cytochrome c-type biogenesis protein CcsB